MDLLKTILLGIVEGITEWLPISSTGHMILVDEFVKLSQSEEFKSMFFVVIQLGAIMAVVFLYFKKLNPFSKDAWKKGQQLFFERENASFFGEMRLRLFLELNRRNIKIMLY